MIILFEISNYQVIIVTIEETLKVMVIHLHLVKYFWCFCFSSKVDNTNCDDRDMDS